jgi:hypothetical protein
LSPDLATALRKETPAAPDALRARIARIAATPPPARRTFPVRRLLAIGVPAALAASVVGAGVIGLVAADAPRDEAAPAERAAPAFARELRSAPLRARLRAADATAGTAVVPSRTRAQDVRAELKILVDDTDELSAATQRALRATRRLGGYLVTVRYGTPEPTEGTAELRVRVPVSRVQAAIVQFSGLGRILAQQTQIADLQQSLDELTRQIRRLERARGPREQIAALRRQRAEISRRAAYALLALDLTTHEPQKAAPAPGRIDRAIDDATGVLAAELAIAAYLLIVAGPFLVLLAAGFATSRAYRRYADQRLLERT